MFNFLRFIREPGQNVLCHKFGGPCICYIHWRDLSSATSMTHPRRVLTSEMSYFPRRFCLRSCLSAGKVLSEGNFCLREDFFPLENIVLDAPCTHLWKSYSPCRTSSNYFRQCFFNLHENLYTFIGIYLRILRISSESIDSKNWVMIEFESIWPSFSKSNWLFF